MLEAARESDAEALLPRGPGGLIEPLCAVYRRSALESISQRFADGTRKITSALEGLAVTMLDVQEVTPFQNLNTPEDWISHAGK